MIEVKPKYILCPLNEEKGINLKVHRDGKKGILGFEVVYDGDVTDAGGKLKDAQKPERVFLNDMNRHLVKAINADPGKFERLFATFKELQANPKAKS